MHVMHNEIGRRTTLVNTKLVRLAYLQQLNGNPDRAALSWCPVSWLCVWGSDRGGYRVRIGVGIGLG